MYGCGGGCGGSGQSRITTCRSLLALLLLLVLFVLPLLLLLLPMLLWVAASGWMPARPARFVAAVELRLRLRLAAAAEWVSGGSVDEGGAEGCCCWPRPATAAAAAANEFVTIGGSRVAMMAAYLGCRWRHGFRADRRNSVMGTLRRVFLKMYRHLLAICWNSEPHKR